RRPARMVTDGKVLFLLISLPFIGCALTGLLRSNDRQVAVWFAGLAALASLLLTIALYPYVSGGKVLHTQLAWLPAYGLNVTLRMDGLAWLFAMLVTGIGLLVVIYARYYMSSEDPVPRFFSFFLAFMGAMLGVVLSGNMIL